MKILHVVRQFAPAIGGLEAYVRDLCLSQQELGHEAEVLTLNRLFHGEHKNRLPVKQTLDGVKIHRIGFVGHRRYFLPFLPLKLMNEYDIIHVHNTDMLYDSIGLLKLAGIIKKPIYATTHGGFFHTETLSNFKQYYFKFITKLTSKRYRKVFAISQNDYDTFTKIMPETKLILQPNAITPLGDFITNGEDYLYIGRLAQHKNVSQLIECFAVMKQQHKATGKLHIIGPEWDVKRDSLKALAEKLNIAEHVVIHGYISQDEMHTVLKQSSVFLSASSFEGFGMSMLEGMSVGLVPFVQPNQSFTELVAKGGIGETVDFNNAPAAAAQIIAALPTINPDLRKQAQKFSQEFSWDSLSRNAIAVYSQDD